MSPPGDDLSPEAIQLSLATRYVGRNCIYLASTTSTMDRAHQEAKGGALEGTIVVAEEQTAGRGRFQRPWVSPRGNAIYLSVILRPELPHLLKLNMVASLAVVRSVRRETGLEPRVKWPNDVEIGGKKLCGILIDTAVTAEAVDYAILGLGVNVALDPAQHPEIAGIATSLSQALGRPVRRLPVLASLLLELEALYETVRRGGSILGEWRSCLNTLGRTVQVTWPGEQEEKPVAEEGVAEDVDEEGALLLRRADGTQARVVAGEVSLRG